MQEMLIFVLAVLEPLLCFTVHDREEARTCCRHKTCPVARVDSHPCKPVECQFNDDCFLQLLRCATFALTFLVFTRPNVKVSYCHCNTYCQFQYHCHFHYLSLCLEFQETCNNVFYTLWQCMQQLFSHAGAHPRPLTPLLMFHLN